MYFRTYKDLNQGILKHLADLPENIDLIVGVPRSGLMLAAILSCYLNLPLTSLDDFLDGRLFTSGITKPKTGWIKSINEARKILIVEDSVSSGNSIKMAKKRIVENSLYANKCIYFAAYVSPESIDTVDFYIEKLPGPRIFQWNFMQHEFLEESCSDIDGVLCEDPTPKENDDGENYRHFLLNARVKLIPRRKIKYLVTARLEKYRLETEQWLSQHHIQYEELIMLNVESAEERRKLGSHASFKADFYRKINAPLFIESEDEQAREIFRLTNKPVFCIDSQQFYFDTHREYVKARLFGKKERIKRWLLQFGMIRFLNKKKRWLLS